MTKIGERVGAIMSATAESVKMFGFGVYVGDEVPTADVGGFGHALHERGIPNPTIQLDSGVKVYGCECWWGPEDQIRGKIGNRKVIEVDIRSVRPSAVSQAREGEK